MKKVIVIGSPGAGKSVFSRQLSEKTGLPFIHLDMVWHKSDKTHISREEFDAFLSEKFKEEQWIMDGDYSRTLEVRLKNADTIFFLDYPVEICLEGIRERVGQKRPDMPWVAEHLNEEFVKSVENYPSNEGRAVCEVIEKYKEEKNIIIFKSREEAAEFLRELSLV